VEVERVKPTVPADGVRHGAMATSERARGSGRTARCGGGGDAERHAEEMGPGVDAETLRNAKGLFGQVSRALKEKARMAGSTWTYGMRGQHAEREVEGDAGDAMVCYCRCVHCRRDLQRRSA
jgi:hypothetical protein